MQAHYIRLFADADGESCFEDVTVDLTRGDLLVRGADALAIAPFLQSEGTFFAVTPPSWKGTALHPAPRRFIAITLEGEYEVTTSKGDTRRIAKGTVLIIEDTTGKGHSTSLLSGRVVSFCVALPDV